MIGRRRRRGRGPALADMPSQPMPRHATPRTHQRRGQCPGQRDEEEGEDGGRQGRRRGRAGVVDVVGDEEEGQGALRPEGEEDEEGGEGAWGGGGVKKGHRLLLILRIGCRPRTLGL